MSYLAYFDESENTPQKHAPDSPPAVYCIAGCISTAEQWKKFQKKWQTALDKYVLPSWRKVYGEKIPVYFHMTDLANRYNKVYEGWSEHQKQALLQELHAIMKRYCVKRFATCVPIADYQALNDKEKYVFGHPHEAATVNCLKNIMTWADNVGLQEPMQYVFEQGSSRDKPLKQALSRMSNEEKVAYRVFDIAFESKTSLPLQAADIFATEARWEACRQLNPNNKRPPRKSYLNMLAPSLDQFSFLGASHFRKVLNMPMVQECLSQQIRDEDVENAKKKKLI